MNPTDLGIVAAQAALEATGVPPEAVDQTVFANVAQAAEDAYYVPRHVGLYAGVPLERPALLVQRICGSGLEAVVQAAEQICLGKADVVLVGGTESMSRNPVAAYEIRMGFELGRPGFVDTLWATLMDPAAGCTMGETAENLARRYGLSREEVDAFALASQERYAAARDRGFFDGELAAVPAGEIPAPGGLPPRRIRLPRGVERVERDEHPRATSMERLASLRPSFRKDGVQTAGNSSGIVDGACALVVASEAAAARLGARPLARVVASASVGVPPEIMGIAPAPAIRRLAELAGVAVADIERFEINEAFGAQCLAVLRELELDHGRVNVNGGAIAVGHPLAATGARLILTL
ncbi:MAG: thiolase family protein, partial [Nitrospirae bacterium]